MSVTIRPVTAEDADRLARLKGDGWYGDPYDIIACRVALAQQERGVYLLAEQDGRIVGHVLLKFDGKPTAPDYPNIEDLYVHPGFRRQGIATRLLHQCEAIANARGHTAIGLAATVDDHAPARLLYAQQGYVPTGGEPYVDGVYDDVEDWVIDLTKWL